ncbi:hypothetical protein THAOC_00075 [Thalassiosira oceanica]|uniref:Uncharacterized protein n=1 Tax=Thalassiosira oceanica TaxID=159749 RepID=K0TK37_THAOC|nr:hypothetical protein THAOC_00075 [Thalassiosira oceanica]|eukprot:EJK78050.1 hypothetical protein THAOC_00075 [Thalassiosira oceanica]
MEECDEALLASLVLLIRQSDVEGENATSRSRRLGRDLAKDGCKLLCFTGRLVNRYISRSDRLSDVLLRLAARALLLRYAPSLSHQRADPNTEEHDSQGQPQQEYELLILTSLIETIRKRSMHSIEVEAVDVEITLDQSNRRPGIKEARRGGRAKNDGNSAKTIEAEDGGDEDLMTRTIRSILEAGDAEAGNDWNDAYDVAVLSCLQACSDKLAGSQFPVWNQNTMLKMVKWFQIGDSNSVRVNELILQHLHLCLFHKGSSNSNSDNIASFLMTVPDGTDDNETNTHALKSFIFYSIVAPESSATGNRLNSFRLAIQLWQSYGTDWLLDGCSQSSRNGPDLWWFKSNSTQESFGRTWPLCSLIRLAAGEFRMGLSSFISDIEDGKAPRSLAEIDSCGVIILETVQLMTSIAEDRGDLSIWTPDAILHTRKSLEDALDATVQYFTSFSEDEYIKCLSKIDEGWTEVGQTCCAVLGTIAADLELDFLFDMRRKNQDEHQHSSLFAYALRSCLLFCKSGESLGKPIQNEPLPFIIPCLLNLSSEQQSDDEATSAISILCKDDCLFLSVDDYLVHLFIQMPRESNADRFLPLIRSCLLILDMCASRMSVEMKKKLACTLKKWEGELLAQECYGEIKDLLVLCT